MLGCRNTRWAVIVAQLLPTTQIARTEERVWRDWIRPSDFVVTGHPLHPSSLTQVLLNLYLSWWVGDSAGWDICCSLTLNNRFEGIGFEPATLWARGNYPTSILHKFYNFYSFNIYRDGDEPVVVPAVVPSSSVKWRRRRRRCKRN